MDLQTTKFIILVTVIVLNKPTMTKLSKYCSEKSCTVSKGAKASSSSSMSEVVIFSCSYDSIYRNDSFFQNESQFGQPMIVDSGCPRSLMGWKEFEKLKRGYETELLKIKEHEKFRFGPSKTFNSESKVRVPMRIGDTEIFIDFFIIEANIPILIGNDFLKPIEGSIDISGKKLVLKRIDETIEMIETPGGYFVIPEKKCCVCKS